MSSNILRSAFRVSFLITLAALLCLMLPRSINAADVGGGIAAQVPSISDIADSAYQAEIGYAVRMGYMSLSGGSSFKPENKIRAKDFLTGIQRGLEKTGITASGEYKAEDLESWITRQQAVRMLVSTLMTKAQLTQLDRVFCGSALYLSDFTDATDVASWAEPYYATAVYKGLIGDRQRLYPKEDATREFAATLLTRAFPDPSAFTGLVVYVGSSDFKRCMNVQVVCGSDVVYPKQDSIPSITYSETPGVASFCSSVEEAKQRRVGANPLMIAAESVQRGGRNELQIVIPAIEAKAIQEADQKGLFLKSWRVAIVPVVPNAQTALAPAAPQ